MNTHIPSLIAVGCEYFLGSVHSLAQRMSPTPTSDEIKVLMSFIITYIQYALSALSWPECVSLPSFPSGRKKGVIAEMKVRRQMHLVAFAR
jgi:hypothetical protein